VTNSEGGLVKRGSRHDALESGKFHRIRDRDYCIAGESSEESVPPSRRAQKKEKKIPQRIRYTAANKESYLVAWNVFGFAD
jgi:hypothetical protein